MINKYVSECKERREEKRKERRRRKGRRGKIRERVPSSSHSCCFARLHVQTDKASCPWHRVCVGGERDSGNKNRKGQTALFTFPGSI